MFTPGSASYIAAGEPSAGTVAGPALAVDDRLAALELATGQEACERLLSIDGLPMEVDTRTRRRMAELAPTFQALAATARFQPVSILVPGGWSLHGASIAPAPDGFRLLVRSANVTRNPDQSRTIHDARGIVRGRAYWVELDAGLTVRAVHAINDHGLRRGDIAIPASGIFHGRPFVHRDDWWIVGAIGDPEAGQTPVPLLARLDGDWLRDTAVLRRNVGPDPRWNPVVDDRGGPPRFLASVFPTVVWRMHDAARAAHPHVQSSAPLIARRLIGGTHLIPADGGYLSLAYEQVALEDGGLQTVHRWLWFDDDLFPDSPLAAVRAPSGGAERASGLTRRGDKLVFSLVQRCGGDLARGRFRRPKWRHCSPRRWSSTWKASSASSRSEPASPAAATAKPPRRRRRG